MSRRVLWIGLVCVLIVGGFVGYYAYAQRGSSSASNYRTAPVARQDVVATISATGTLVPEETVDVGTQVNGQIASFGLDADGKTVDYRSVVKKDAILARIDDALYAAQVASDQAAVQSAQSALRVAQANRDQANAKLQQATLDWERAQKLGRGEALSQSDYDAAKSNFDQATAGLTVAEAQVGQADAQIAVAKASLVRSQRNLDFCTIHSPVDGVIIDRRVDIGQTVVSSLNAPSLFLIAKDLSRMQVLVQVNEADIAHVTPGQTVMFTVDALAGERFKGEVRKVRLNATMTQNVVTYTVEIIANNPDLKLLPYLTANVRFIVGKTENVLTVPNAALRWSPPDAAAQADASSPQSPGGRRPTSRPADASGVWVVSANGSPRRIAVKAGLSDGTVTAIESDELKEGDNVILGEAVTAAAPQGTTNPFAPRMNRGGNRPGGGGR